MGWSRRTGAGRGRGLLTCRCRSRREPRAKPETRNQNPESNGNATITKRENRAGNSGFLIGVRFGLSESGPTARVSGFGFRLLPEDPLREVVQRVPPVHRVVGVAVDVPDVLDALV